MKNNILDDLLQSAKNQKLNILNLVIRQNGEVIAKHDFEEEKPRLLWSASKTFTSMATGIAMNEGYFKLDDKIKNFFKDTSYINESEYLNNMTIHDLLCMGTGHEKCPITKVDWKSSEKWDISKLFFDEEIKFKPGTHFTYDNSATYMLSKIISITTGISLDKYVDEKIFKHLNIETPRWDKCPQGVTQGFSGLYLKAEDVSRFGQLILDKGIWKGKEIIPSTYIEKATSIQIKTDDFNPYFATIDHHQGYGYQMWMNSYPNSYRMDGLNGQYVVILPDKNAVITYISHEEKNMSNILELTWNTLIDKL